jgi:hypothetical protein
MKLRQKECYMTLPYLIHAIATHAVVVKGAPPLVVQHATRIMTTALLDVTPRQDTFKTVQVVTRVLVVNISHMVVNHTVTTVLG